jgi:trigger factor
VKTVAELREKIAEAAKNALDKEAKDLAQSQVLAQLVERNQFAVPQPMVDEEIELLIKRRMSVPEGQTLNLDYFRPVFEAEATQRVRGLILVDKVAKIESLSVSDEDVTKRIDSVKDLYGLSAADVERLTTDVARRKLIEQDLIREQALELLVGRATISYVAATPEKPLEGAEASPAEETVSVE